MEQLTLKDIHDVLIEQSPEDIAYQSEAMKMIDRWLERGDGVAVYRNEDLNDHIWLGHCKIVSYGSKQAQLEVDEPPRTLPDFPTEINWRYQLVGVFRLTRIEEISPVFEQSIGRGTDADG